MTAKAEINWKSEPDRHDYPAAASYLALIMSPRAVEKIIDDLQKAEEAEFKAKDLVRASGHDPLTSENAHVRKNLDRIARGEKLSPVLLVRSAGRVIIADGYHRVSAVYRHDEDAIVPCRIVGP